MITSSDVVAHMLREEASIMRSIDTPERIHVLWTHETIDAFALHIRLNETTADELDRLQKGATTK